MKQVRIMLAVWCVAAVMGICPTRAFADPGAGFIRLGDLPGGEVSSCAYGISADWSTVVGSSSSSAMGEEAFRWTLSGGMVGLGDLPGGPAEASMARRVSADGSVIVGYADKYYFDRATGFRWTQATGMVSLGFLPGGCFSSPGGVSANGSVIVGGANSSRTNPSLYGDGEAYIWKPDTGIVSMGMMPNGSYYAVACDVSPDGTIVAGDFGGSTPFIWRAETGVVGLGIPPSESGGLGSVQMSADGKVAVASWQHYHGSSESFRSYRWTEDSGWVSLGSIDAKAWAISDDGDIIVGQGWEGGLGAFIWDEAHGLRPLKDVVEQACGINLDGWQLGSAYDIARDPAGSNYYAIVGTGINPDGFGEAYLAIVPEPATMTLLVLGGLAVLRRRKTV